MSKLNTVQAFLSHAGIELVTNSNQCVYDDATDTIFLSKKELSSISLQSSISIEEVELFITLHELGHRNQSVELVDMYSYNPIPAEENAWDRAELIHVQLWGKPSQEFYKLKAMMLNTYYVEHEELLVWS
jgi:hypothetical protein